MEKAFYFGWIQGFAVFHGVLAVVKLTLKPVCNEFFTIHYKAFWFVAFSLLLFLMYHFLGIAISVGDLSFLFK